MDAETKWVEEARAGDECALELAKQLGNPAAESMELVDFGFLLCQQGSGERGRTMGFCCKKLRRNTMGVPARFLFRLGGILF